MKKALVYTLFAIVMMLSVMSLFTLEIMKSKGLSPKISEKIRTDEVYYFIDGINDDLSRSSYISGKRALIALVDKIAASGNFTEPLVTAKIIEMVENGTLDGETIALMQGTTQENWINNIINLGKERDFVIKMQIINTTAELKDAFNINLTNKVNMQVNDTKTKIRFNRTFNSESDLLIENIEDPFNTIKSYGSVRRVVNYCEKYAYHAKNAASGNKYAGNWISGRAMVISNQISSLAGIDYNGKILIVKDIPDNYAGINNFKGVVSENATEDNSTITIPYVFGATGITSQVANDTLVVLNNDDVWVNNIYDELLEGCYFEDASGPSFFDRLEGNYYTTDKYRATNKTIGLGSFIDVSQLQIELQKYGSGVDYIYFGASSPTIYKIKGVTESKNGVALKNMFRLDDSHVNSFGISELAY